MSYIAMPQGRVLPRLSRRDFTLCKAAVLVALIALGHMTGHLEAAEAGEGLKAFKTAFCDNVAGIGEA
ncbi:hypothetical protein LR948_04770 [Roseivivax sp. GX 12232]|uniref:hypothetical protein n=1 Tax=Roseivivax sp. GX 12232 TaxID=2900547 RepID=UPI001E544B51|nr:hypothetical protein [Roseivivax sp. GX 12232]MCE0504653.1 hypothetical protein [Roseivivax sp. GX 12232]